MPYPKPIMLDEEVIEPSPDFMLPEISITAGEPEPQELPETEITAGAPSREIVDPWEDFLRHATPKEIMAAQPDADADVMEGPYVKRSWSREDIDHGKSDEDKRVDELRALIAARPKQAEGAGRYTKAVEGLGLKPRSRFMAAFSDAGTQAYNSNQNAYANAMMEAMAKDSAEQQGGQYVDDGTLEVLVRTGVMSPQAASQMRMNSPYIKALGQGGLMMGLKQRGQDVGMRTAEAKTDSGERIQESGNQNRLDVAHINADARSKKAGSGGGGAGGGLGAKRASYLSEDTAAQSNLFKTPLSPADAALVLAGQYDAEAHGHSPEAAAYLDRRAALYNTANAKNLDTMAPKVTGRDPGLQAQEDTAISRQAHNPKETKRARDEVEEQRRSVTLASQGWSGLSDGAKRVLAQHGTDDEAGLLSAMKAARLTPDEQVAAARIQKLINQDVKRFAGSAVTGSEWGRIADAIGVSGTLNPWRSPAALGDFLKTAYMTYKSARKSAESTYPDLWKGYGDGTP